MKKLATLGLVLLFSATASAQWGKKVKGNGNISTVERSTGDYDRIGVSGFFDVDLVARVEPTVNDRARRLFVLAPIPHEDVGPFDEQLALFAELGFDPIKRDAHASWHGAIGFIEGDDARGLG